MDLGCRWTGKEFHPQQVVCLRDGAGSHPADTPLQMKLRKYRRIVEQRSQKKHQRSAYHDHFLLPPVPVNLEARPPTSTPALRKKHSDKSLSVSPKPAQRPATHSGARPWAEPWDEPPPPDQKKIKNRPGTVPAVVSTAEPLSLVQKPTTADVQRRPGIAVAATSSVVSSENAQRPVAAAAVAAVRQDTRREVGVGDKGSQGKQNRGRPGTVSLADTASPIATVKGPGAGLASAGSLVRPTTLKTEPRRPRSAREGKVFVRQGRAAKNPKLARKEMDAASQSSENMNVVDAQSTSMELGNETCGCSAVERWVGAAGIKFSRTDSDFADVEHVLRECAKWLALNCNTQGGALMSIADLELACVDLGIHEFEVAHVSQGLWHLLAHENRLHVKLLSGIIEKHPDFLQMHTRQNSAHLQDRVVASTDFTSTETQESQDCRQKLGLVYEQSDSQDALSPMLGRGDREPAPWAQNDCGVDQTFRQEGFDSEEFPMATIEKRSTPVGFLDDDEKDLEVITFPTFQSFDVDAVERGREFTSKPHDARSQRSVSISWDPTDFHPDPLCLHCTQDHTVQQRLSGHPETLSSVSPSQMPILTRRRNSDPARYTVFPFFCNEDAALLQDAEFASLFAPSMDTTVCPGTSRSCRVEDHAVHLAIADDVAHEVTSTMFAEVAHHHQMPALLQIGSSLSSVMISSAPLHEACDVGGRQSTPSKTERETEEAAGDKNAMEATDTNAVLYYASELGNRAAALPDEIVNSSEGVSIGKAVKGRVEPGGLGGQGQGTALTNVDDANSVAVYVSSLVAQVARRKCVVDKSVDKGYNGVMALSGVLKGRRTHQATVIDIDAPNTLAGRYFQALLEIPRPDSSPPWKPWHMQSVASSGRGKRALCKRGHELKRASPSNNGWACDGRSESWGCKSGINDFFQTEGLTRFECRICDFDLCERCHNFLMYSAPNDWAMRKAPRSPAPSRSASLQTSRQGSRQAPAMPRIPTLQEVILRVSHADTARNMEGTASDASQVPPRNFQPIAESAGEESVNPGSAVTTETRFSNTTTFSSKSRGFDEQTLKKLRNSQGRHSRLNSVRGAIGLLFRRRKTHRAATADSTRHIDLTRLHTAGSCTSSNAAGSAGTVATGASTHVLATGDHSM